MLRGQYTPAAFGHIAAAEQPSSTPIQHVSAQTCNAHLWETKQSPITSYSQGNASNPQHPGGRRDTLFLPPSGLQHTIRMSHSARAHHVQDMTPGTMSQQSCELGGSCLCPNQSLTGPLKLEPATRCMQTTVIT